MVMAKVLLTCKGCNRKFEVVYKLRRQKYCTRDCVNKSYSGSGNPSYGKSYRTKETHPEWAQKISSTSLKREINKGDKNGMKNPDVAKRAGETRSKKFSEDADFRESVSAYIRKAWAEGKFNHVQVGRCKWYDHVKPNGETVKLQGTWEVALARHMDNLQLEYHAHRGRMTYTDSAGTQRSYHPDFYVPMWDTYIDVKGAFFTELQKEKFDCVRNCNPSVNVLLITKSDLTSMGIDLTKVPRELLTVSKKPSH